MNATLRFATLSALSAAALLGACRPNDGAGARKTRDSEGAATSGSLESTRTTDSSSGGMPGTQGGQMAGMMSAGTMDSMKTRIRMMEGMSPAQMKAMLPAHRQMVANMLSQFNGDMRKMNMQPDAEWTALTDSVRQDLVRMPDVSASELRSLMPAHGARVMRLMQMHRSMMGGMKP
jgi:hypothetical protein